MMVSLFGKQYTSRELLARVGNIRQLGGIQPIELADGWERGVRAFEVETGSGFAFTVLADRGLDIGAARYSGRSLCYHAPGGFAHPAYYDPHGAGWLQTFGGGLLTTCGLRTVGSPSEDAGETLGLHGRVNHLPAEEVAAWGEWQGDEYLMTIRGTVTDGHLFQAPLRLTRSLTTRLGGNSVVIEDRVENIGGEPAPHMILYHCNLGFPLLDAASQLLLQSTNVVPRDDAARQGLDAWAACQPPTAGFAEQVFYHELAVDEAGECSAALVNPSLDGGLGVYLRYRRDTLPCFVQWKMFGSGTYVLGLEPANCRVGGRAIERAEGRLQILQPGESRSYRVEIGVLAGREATG